MAVANVGKKDFVWTMLATFFKIGAGVLLFPIILKMFRMCLVGLVY